MTTIDQLTAEGRAMTATLMAMEDEIEWRELESEFGSTRELRQLREDRKDLIEQIKAIKAQIKQLEAETAAELPEVAGADESTEEPVQSIAEITVYGPNLDSLSHGTDIIALAIDGVTVVNSTPLRLSRVHTEPDGRRRFYVREELDLERVDGMSGQLTVAYCLREAKPGAGDDTEASASIDFLWFRGDDGAKSQSALGAVTVEVLAMQEWAREGRKIACSPSLSAVAKHAGRLARLGRAVEREEELLRACMAAAVDAGETPHRISVVAGFTAPKAMRWIGRGVEARGTHGQVVFTPRDNVTNDTAV